MHCIGGLPKIIVLNELNFLIPGSIVAKQVYAEFKNSVLNYCQKFPVVMLAVHSRENVGYFCF